MLFFPDRKKVSELTLPSHPLPQKILIESEVWTQSEWFKIEIMNKWIFNHLSKAWWATSLGKCFLNISEKHLCSYLIIQTLCINYELQSGALGGHHWCTWQGKKKIIVGLQQSTHKAQHECLSFKLNGIILTLYPRRRSFHNACTVAGGVTRSRQKEGEGDKSASIKKHFSV